MTRRCLVLLRHANAEQGGRDRDRALTKRGQDDAAAAGDWMAINDVAPDVVVVSPSRRTVQTWEAASGRVPGSPDVRYDDRIYDNSVDDLLAVIREVDDATETLLLIGHNPSTHALALRLAREDAARDELGAFPTATLALFDLEDDWADMPDGACRLVAVATCRGAGEG